MEKPLSRGLSLPQRIEETLSSPSLPAVTPPRMEELDDNLASTQGDLHIDYKQLALEVTGQITPDIHETLASNITTMLTQIKNDVAQHDQCLNAIDEKLLSLESDSNKLQDQIRNILRDNERLRDKLEDLENRCNNLRILGITESILQKDLAHLCSQELPLGLGISHTCKVEKAHRLCPDLRADKLSKSQAEAAAGERPRQFIVKYLEFTDKVSMQAYKHLRGSFELKGHKVLLFADFSAEVAKKHRAFSQICLALFHKQVKLSLIYPETLKVFHPDGTISSFDSPSDAKNLLNLDRSSSS